MFVYWLTYCSSGDRHALLRCRQTCSAGICRPDAQAVRARANRAADTPPAGCKGADEGTRHAGGRTALAQDHFQADPTARRSCCRFDKRGSSRASPARQSMSRET